MSTHVRSSMYYSIQLAFFNPISKESVKQLFKIKHMLNMIINNKFFHQTIYTLTLKLVKL